MMKPRTDNSLLIEFIKESDATEYRQWRVPRAVLDDLNLFKEKNMDAKTTTTPLFKEEHVGKTITVKPKALTPSEPGYRDRAKFGALAQKRMNRAIKAIRLVGQLDRRQGEIEFADAAMMQRALSDECRLASERLGVAARGEPDFSLERPMIAVGEKLGGVGEV